ncbi:MAG: MFS transporter [Akkermansiaceae bacterium]|nr:MFS transporter [Akkermansiaceae bacterium]
MSDELSKKQKSILFWASFISLAAAGLGFAFRIAHMGSYGEEFGLTGGQVGFIAGSCFWPIAITMILFSLVVDKTGYKIPMFIAALLQIASGIGTAMATGYGSLLGFAICAGLGHGIIEAVINPACAAVYPKQKTKMLTILHAAWPAGIVSGTLLIMILDSSIQGGLDWRIHALWIVIPAVAYAIMYIPCKFPVDERVKAGIPFMVMLKQVGFLGASLAAFMLIYQIGGFVLSDIFGLYKLPEPNVWFFGGLIGGLVVGGVFGAITKSLGRPLFFLLCILMIPVAAAELSTDNWIKQLMTPVMEGDLKINANWAIIYSAGVMLLLRLFAGSILQVASPPIIMAVSGIFSASALYWLGASASGILVLVAFTIYAVGQTYYWPCILGFVAERFPQGGALTLNTVSAMALLSLGMVGNPILGVAQDRSIYEQSQEKAPELVEEASAEKPYLWMKYKAIEPSKLPEIGADKIDGQGEALIAALNPIINSDKEIKEDYADLKTSKDDIDLKAIQTYDFLKAKAGKDEKLKKKLEASIPAGVEDGLEEYNTKLATFNDMKTKSGRDVLKFAAWFPFILVIAFGCIAFYFISRGGYKPVELKDLSGGREAPEL